MSKPLLPSTVLITALCCGPAAACPVCDGETGQEVRATLINDDLGTNVLAVAAPFVVVGGVVALVHLGHPSRRRR